VVDIYYVEAEADISHAVRAFLARDGYRVWVFPTLSEIRQALCCMLPSLVLVDWNMPEENGRFLCQWIRQTWSELPVIFITVRGDSRDGYIVKPFALDVLRARIRALLRRRETAGQQPLTCGEVTLDRDRRQVCCGAETVSLSTSEYQLLLYLLQNKGRTVTREKLIERVWDANGNAVNDNTLTVTMKRLREKLHQPACLKTVRGVGYRMEETE
jgi:DNA-binding response OmpR family regulator